MKKLFVLFAAIALVGFAVPAMAVDWNFYGSARMATYYDSNDYKDSALRQGTNVNSKDAETQWDLQGNSRIGAQVKADAVSGRVELGLKGSGTGDVDVGTRRIYGVWNFGPGTLKVGKDYTPVSQFISGQAFDGDLGLLGIGTAYGNRTGQIALGFGGFEIAFIQPATGQLAGLGASALDTAAIDALNEELEAAIEAGDPAAYAAAQAGLAILEAVPSIGSTAGDVDQVIPKIEAKYGMSFDTWNFNVMGGVNYYTIQDVPSFTNPGDTNDIDVTSWIVGADAGVNFGPAYVKAAGSYGVNVGNAAWNIPGNSTLGGGSGTWDGDDKVDKNYSWMAALVAGLKVSDMLSFEGGFGYRQDNPKDAPDGFDNKEKVWAAYVQGVIALAPGVYLIPEVGYYDWDKDYTDAKAGSRFYAGGKWQIDF